MYLLTDWLKLFVMVTFAISSSPLSSLTAAVSLENDETNAISNTIDD